MFAANIVEDRSRRTSASVSNVIEPLTDAFLSVGACRNVKQSLISLGILHDRRCLPLYGKHAGRLVFLSRFMKSPERRRKVVSDWMSLVRSSTRLLLSTAPY
jgi:hypothetical protein